MPLEGNEITAKTPKGISFSIRPNFDIFNSLIRIWERKKISLVSLLFFFCIVILVMKMNEKKNRRTWLFNNMASGNECSHAMPSTQYKNQQKINRPNPCPFSRGTVPSERENVNHFVEEKICVFVDEEHI